MYQDTRNEEATGYEDIERRPRQLNRHVAGSSFSTEYLSSVSGQKLKIYQLVLLQKPSKVSSSSQHPSQ